MVTGLLALVGGAEFTPGNEDQDRLLVARRGAGEAYVVPTAAARQQPERAVATAVTWFNELGMDVSSLPVLKRPDGLSPGITEQAERGGCFYLVGGDPGLVVDILHDTPVWRAIVAAWRRGAALAGSSAGAMAFGEWTLVRKSYPGHAERRCKPALGLVPRIAVAPHFDTFGHRWVDSVLAESPVDDLMLVGIDERSAVVWDGQAWTAHGPGTVTTVTRAARHVYPSGATVDMPTPAEVSSPSD